MNDDPNEPDPIPTPEWVKGLALVAVVIVLVAALFLLANGPRSADPVLASSALA